jgi:hypothetical protein
MPTHCYETRLHWTGSTGLGWERYDRRHSATAPPARQEVGLTTLNSEVTIEPTVETRAA